MNKLRYLPKASSNLYLAKTGYSYHYQKQKTLIYKSIKLQVIAILLITVIIAGLLELLGWPILDIFYYIASVIVGGLCAMIPNIYFAYYSFRNKYSGARDASKILNNLYFAEAIKFLLVICLLSISYSLGVKGVFKSYGTQGILIGFIFVYTSMIFLPLVTKE